MHHSEHQFHNVTRLEAPPTQRLFQSNGSSFSTRRILVHDAGGISEITLFANAPKALDLLFCESLEGELAKMNTETLDALSNTIRAERQSRETPPALSPGQVGIGQGNTAGDAVDEPALEAVNETMRQVLPRDCPGVTVTEDDGLPF